MKGSIRKRGPEQWQARYRAPGGDQRSETFRRRLDAERWLRTQLVDKDRGEWVDPKLGQLVFAEWVTTWEPTTLDLRPTTRELNLGVVRNYLLPRFGAWPLAGIRTSDIQAMVSEETAAASLSTSAVRRHVLVLSPILEAAVLDGRIARNPCRGVKLPPATTRRMRFLGPEDVQELAGAFVDHYRPLILTAAYVGLRWGELAGLAIEHVDPLRARVRIERQLLEVGGQPTFGPPKTKAGIRTVSIPRSLAELLGAHMGAEAIQASGLVFPTPGGQPMRRSNFNRTWRRIVDGTERRPGIFRGTALEGLVFHELRHTAAALAIAQGAHPLVIRERLGHSSITVTMDTYGGLFPRIDEQITERLDAVLSETMR